LLLPARVALSFNYGGFVRALGVNRAAFWLVLAVGVLVFVVRLIRR
jgi:hypothetical protein